MSEHEYSRNSDRWYRRATYLRPPQLGGKLIQDLWNRLRGQMSCDSAVMYADSSCQRFVGSCFSWRHDTLFHLISMCSRKPWRTIACVCSERNTKRVQHTHCLSQLCEVELCQIFQKIVGQLHKAWTSNETHINYSPWVTLRSNRTYKSTLVREITGFPGFCNCACKRASIW